MAALERGELDAMSGVPTRNVERIKKNPAYRIVERPSLRLIYLGLDCGRDASPGILEPAGRNPLKDPRVRRALALGIDNRLIVKAIMGGHAQPADQLQPEGVIGHDPAIRLDRPDYARAKTLLAEAGYPNGFKLRLDGPNDRYVNDKQILQAVAQELARIGVAVTVNAQPKARFFADERAGACSFFLIGWSNTNGDGMATFEHLLHTPDAAHNLGGRTPRRFYSNARSTPSSPRRPVSSTRSGARRWRARPAASPWTNCRTSRCTSRRTSTPSATGSSGPPAATRKSAGWT
jgi:peptide/nickel transport system substrate-binding protein